MPDSEVITLQQPSDVPSTIGNMPQDTDIANALRFVHQHGNIVRWTAERGWFVYDGRRWVVDAEYLVERKARETVQSLFDEIREAPDQDEIFRWAKKSQTARSIRDMIFLVRTFETIPAALSDFDADPWKLNCANGQIDLRTGRLEKHEPTSMCSRLVPVEFDDRAKCPRWVAFLDRIFSGDVELIHFMRMAVGYSLTGLTSEQCLFFCYGSGANGKSVFLETLQRLWGDYGQNTRTETITSRREPGIPNDVARLAGARLIAINETSENQKLNEPLIKDMTGGDTMTARFLRREYFDFHPEFKLWLRGNHKPEIHGTDDGIWRRIRLIPFEVTIPEAERDGDLINKLADELPGILAWAVAGCLQWQRDGLNAPAAISDAVREYRSEMDILGQFIADRCEVQQHGQVTAKALYLDYTRWAASAGEVAVSQTKFGRAMTERGFRKSRVSAGHVYHGLSLPVTDGRQNQ